MRLCTIRLDEGETAAVELPCGVVTVAEINQRTGYELPTDMLRIIVENRGDDLHKVVSVLDPSSVTPVPDPVFGPPLRTPPKLWGIGLNYRGHADDLEVSQPTDGPGSYLRPNTTIIGPGDDIILPEQSQRVTAEAELGIIVARDCKNVSIDEAPGVIFGFTTILDMTAEDLIRRNPRFIPRAKAFDTFCSFGPWVVTPDEITDLPSVRVQTVRNGEVIADNVVSGMRFDPYWLISFHSKVMTFQAGDVIATGTPGAAVISDGDIAEARVGRVGVLTNPVRTP